MRLRRHFHFPSFTQSSARCDSKERQEESDWGRFTEPQKGWAVRSCVEGVRMRAIVMLMSRRRPPSACSPEAQSFYQQGLPRQPQPSS